MRVRFYTALTIVAMLANSSLALTLSNSSEVAHEAPDAISVAGTTNLTQNSADADADIESEADQAIVKTMITTAPVTSNKTEDARLRAIEAARIKQAIRNQVLVKEVPDRRVVIQEEPARPTMKPPTKEETEDDDSSDSDGDSSSDTTSSDSSSSDDEDGITAEEPARIQKVVPPNGIVYEARRHPQFVYPAQPSLVHSHYGVH